jgi:hypothetical protein
MQPHPAAAIRRSPQRRSSRTRMRAGGWNGDDPVHTREAGHDSSKPGKATTTGDEDREDPARPRVRRVGPPRPQQAASSARVEPQARSAALGSRRSPQWVSPQRRSRDGAERRADRRGRPDRCGGHDLRREPVRRHLRARVSRRGVVRGSVRAAPRGAAADRDRRAPAWPNSWPRRCSAAARACRRSPSTGRSDAARPCVRTRASPTSRSAGTTRSPSPTSSSCSKASPSANRRHGSRAWRARGRGRGARGAHGAAEHRGPGGRRGDASARLRVPGEGVEPSCPARGTRF